MKITVVNRQSQQKLHPDKVREFVAFCMCRAAALAGDRVWRDVNVVLADDAEMASVNRIYLDEPSATDVISFYLPPLPGGRKHCAGVIFVNVARALAEGARRCGVEAELALYLAHGCDHLSGADDRTAAMRRRMRRREMLWISAARRAGKLRSFF